MTHRIYSYREFELTLDVQPCMPADPAVIWFLPRHYVCHVQMRSESMQCALPPIVIAADGGKRFHSEGDAIFAACCAAEYAVDRSYATITFH